MRAGICEVPVGSNEDVIASDNSETDTSSREETFSSGDAADVGIPE